jgi:hypothetical protein
MTAFNAVGRLSTLFLFFILYTNNIVYSTAQPTMAPTMNEESTMAPTMNAQSTMAPTMNAQSTMAPTMNAQSTMAPTMKSTIAPTMSTGPQDYTVTQVSRDRNKSCLDTVAVVAVTDVLKHAPSLNFFLPFFLSFFRSLSLS